MSIKIHTAEYVKSAPTLQDCPEFDGAAEIACVGRSNVGKSSLINSLLGRKNLARTSNTPGKTRLLNFYDIRYALDKDTSKTVKTVIFVDLPGYGYAKVSKTEQEHWRKNLERYLRERPHLRLVLQMIDARHEPQESDILMFEWLQHHGLPVQVVLTKADKISKSDLQGRIAQTARALDLSPAQIIGYSAEKHTGKDILWARLLESLQKPGAPRDQSGESEDEYTLSSGFSDSL